jgi:hypothetical protein
MLTFKRTVLAGALLVASLGLGNIGCTDKNDAGKLPPASDGAAGADGGGSDTKADGTPQTDGAGSGGTGGAATDGGGAGGAGGAASDASAG